MRKRVFTLIMVLILLSCLPVATYAETLVDLDAKGSITVKAVYKKVPLEGMKLNCIQVGKLVPYGDAYYYESLYHDAIYTSEDIHNTKHPGEMLKLVKNGTSVAYTKSADKSGYIKFSNLKPGLYLIYQTDSFTMSGNKYEIREFFVTIPYDGKYDVDAKSKPGLDLYPEEPPKQTTSGTSSPKPAKLPQTGQLNWPVPVMAISGMTLFIIGWWLCFGSRKDRNEN